MSERFETANFTVDLRAGWRSRQNTPTAVFHTPHGHGALHLSVHHMEGEVSDAELQAFAACRINASAGPKQIQSGAFRGQTLRYATHGAYWREWYLRSGTVIVYATYNCDPENEGKEDAAVDRILESLRLQVPTEA